MWEVAGVFSALSPGGGLPRSVKRKPCHAHFPVAAFHQGAGTRFATSGKGEQTSPEDETVVGSLEDYQHKRDFRRTQEPSAKGPRSSAGTDVGPIFVVQQHAARRLHYDFRLELDGVLESWAVPKGPSLDPEVKRLAVQVEAHPLEYANFEGVIAPGQYGAGAVIVWDRGRWHADGDARQGMKRGKLELVLEGEKLTGRWLLVRLEDQEATGATAKPNWLLRKLADEAARPGDGDQVLARLPQSVLSGRTLEQVRAEPQQSAPPSTSDSVAEGTAESATLAEMVGDLPGARRGELPAFVEPQLARLGHEPPPGEDWQHEIKLDGYRMLCRVESGQATLLSRSGQDWTKRFAVIARDAEALEADRLLLDGEVVWLRPDGRSDFQSLQGALAHNQRGARAESGSLSYVAFDILHLDGSDLRGCPLVERQRVLAHLFGGGLPAGSRLRLSTHHRGDGALLLERACTMGLEGIVSKRAEAPYRSGRGRDWVKVRCRERQELVIVGYAVSDEAASPGTPSLRSLLVATTGELGLTYAGKVGTGFDTATRESLVELLAPLARKTSPLAAPGPRVVEPDVVWVEPRLLAEVRFSGWTRDGILRHASYLGLRDDKDPAEVVRETNADPAPNKRRPVQRRPAPLRGKAARLTNPQRVLYPSEQITKADLARYFEAVAEVMLPELEGRPLSVVRCPRQVDDGCFYQKHFPEPVPPGLRSVDLEPHTGEPGRYLLVESARGLRALAQLGVVEIHAWGSRMPQPERPDRLVFDLDPDAAVSWPEVIAAARQLRDLLEGLGLASFPRLTGGKGVHVVVPIAPDLLWPSARKLARAIAGLLVTQTPMLYTVNPKKSARPGRIFIDYLRNSMGATAIASYSPRARPGAAVAVPIRWDELGANRPPDFYTVKNVPRRLGSLKGPVWDDAQVRDQRLPAAVRRKVGVSD